jgi:hypothetical protein
MRSRGSAQGDQPEIVRILRKGSMREIVRILRKGCAHLEVTNPGRSQLTIPSWEPDKPGTGPGKRHCHCHPEVIDDPS